MGIGIKQALSKTNCTHQLKSALFDLILIGRDLIKNNRKLESSDSVNDNINISNSISIISDPYANENFHKMRYAKFMGTEWKVTNVEVQYPRLILTLGGVYNG